MSVNSLSQSTQARPRKPIQSFAKRGRPLTPRQQRAFTHHQDQYLVSPATIDQLIAEYGCLKPELLFDNKAPIILEIGFGMGHSLLEDLARHRQFNYLGIEVHQPGVGHLMVSAYEQKLEHLKIIMQDAKPLLESNISQASFDKIQILFPDPWPKARHHKRRLLQVDFINHLADKIKAGGCLHIATDHADYAEHINEVITHCPTLTRIDRFDRSSDSPVLKNNIMIQSSLQRPETKYERRGLGKGHSIVDFILVKTS